MADHNLSLEQFRDLVLRDQRRLIALHPERWTPEYIATEEKKIATADRTQLYRIHRSTLAILDMGGG